MHLMTHLISNFLLCIFHSYKRSCTPYTLHYSYIDGAVKAISPYPSCYDIKGSLAKFSCYQSQYTSVEIAVIMSRMIFR